jgi:hypothetical protein
MQGAALSGLIKLMEIGHIDERDELLRYKKDIINIIGRIFSKNIDKTIYIRYKLYYRLTGDVSEALYYLTKSPEMEVLYTLLLDPPIEDIILSPTKFIHPLRKKESKKLE